MVLDLLLINEDATLNSYIFIGTQRFVPGAAFDIMAKLMQPDKDIRYIPDSGATLSMTLKKNDGSDLVLAGSFPFADDRSIIKFSVTAGDSADLIGQSLTAEITEGANVSFAILKNGLQSILAEC